MCAVGINTCSSRLCPALKQRPVREPASTHVRSFTWEIPRSTHFCVLTQNYYPSAHISVPVASQLSAAKITCRYLQPASTHAFMFIMHVSYPPAHTFVCPKPVSAHTVRFISVESAAAYFNAESGTIPPAHISSWLVKKCFAQPYSCCTGLVMVGWTDALKRKDAGHSVCSYIRNGFPSRTHICSLLIHHPSGAHVQGSKYNIPSAHIIISLIKENS